MFLADLYKLVVLDLTFGGGEVEEELCLMAGGPILLGYIDITETGTYRIRLRYDKYNNPVVQIKLMKSDPDEGDGQDFELLVDRIRALVADAKLLKEKYPDLPGVLPTV